MNQFTALLEHFPAALLVIFRIGGLAIYAPVIGSQIIAARGRALFAIVLGFAIYPILYVENLVSAPLHLDMWTLVPLLALEILIGMVIGFIASLPMIAVQISGLMMGQQMGLGFAKIFNPTMGASADIIGQMLFFMALAGFLLIGGLDAMVLAVLNTFHHMPLGTNIVDGSLLEMLLGVVLAAYEIAMRIAAPLLALIYLQTISLGFISKSVPQLNILSLGFPMRIIAGLTIIMVSLGVINEVLLVWIEDVLQLTLDWVENY